MISQMLLASTVLCSSSGDTPARARELVERSVAAANDVRDATYRLHKRERSCAGDVSVAELEIKLRREPFAVYVRGITPRRGMEAIYPVRGDQLIAHPGRFPDVTILLDPEGSLALRNAHAPVYETGFARATQRLRDALALLDEGMAQVRLGSNRMGQRCLAFDARGLPERQVQARRGERLLDLARRTNVAAYAILCRNPHVDSVRDQLDPQVPVTVPGFDAQRMTVCFHPDTGLVASEYYHDDNGLWASYEKSDLRVNVGLTDRDFDPDNDAYDF